MWANTVRPYESVFVNLLTLECRHKRLGILEVTVIPISSPALSAGRSWREGAMEQVSVQLYLNARLSEISGDEMRRYVPKTYNNRRFLRIIIRTIVTVLLTALVLFIALFFWLRDYEVPDEDGTKRLDIPWLMDEPAASRD